MSRNTTATPSDLSPGYSERAIGLTHQAEAEVVIVDLFARL
jgi:hypothetical protein